MRGCVLSSDPAPCLHEERKGIFTWIVILIISLSEPDAPENFTVTVIDSSSVRATWDNPLDSNGIILRFLLTLELTPGQDYLFPLPHTTSLAQNQFELIISGLHPFARYVFMLRAATLFGEGNVTDAIEMTNEAGNELLKVWCL